jgi:hypothetical protein
MPNRLADTQSPYLLQHKDNPVDWYPWGEAAFAKANAEEKPIFLSIGYSTCHWCHVMEEESFEDDDVAAALNETFVAIKVDREERPDIDSLYMSVCQMMNGQGGWPLNVLLTPDKKPFYATTYLPKQGRFGRMGLMDLIGRVRQLWNSQRDELLSEADKITSTLQEASVQAASGDVVDTQTLDQAYSQLADRFDATHGGFGTAPKFPSPHNLLFLLRYALRADERHALDMVETTLDQMRLGGVFDHVGYGFHRYSTDQQWLLPHFEKMLYDQAMLIMAYAEAYQVFGKEAYAQTIRETIEYVTRDLRDTAGGFYSAEDADSETAAGEMEEGAFYVWSVDEIRDLLDSELADCVVDVYNLRAEGNYVEEATRERTGKNILHLTKPLDEIARQRNTDEETLRDQLEAARTHLFRRRESRPRPRLDDKVLTDWNGLMIAALAKAARALDMPRYAEVASEAASFLLETMRDDSGRLLHRYRHGDAAIRAHLDDYAFLVWGLIELYQATFDAEWLGEALCLMEEALDYHWDEERGGFHITAKDGEALIVRQKEFYDGAVPSGNSAALYNLMRLARMTERPDFEDRAQELVDVAAGQMQQQPSGFTALLVGLDFALGPAQEVVVAGIPNREDTQAMIQKLHATFAPRTVVLLRQTQQDEPLITRYAPFTREQRALEGQATAYVCEHFQCEAPTTDPAALRDALLSLPATDAV